MLDEFRIDPNLDKALKSMYENSSSQVTENGLPPDVEQILDQIHNPGKYCFVIHMKLCQT